MFSYYFFCFSWEGGGFPWEVFLSVRFEMSWNLWRKLLIRLNFIIICYYTCTLGCFFCKSVSNVGFALGNHIIYDYIFPISILSVWALSHSRGRSSGHHSNSCAGRGCRCSRRRQLEGGLPFRVWERGGGLYLSDRQADQWGLTHPFKGKQHKPCCDLCTHTHLTASLIIYHKDQLKIQVQMKLIC